MIVENKNLMSSKALEELIRIDKYADKWCQDNGYPIRRKKYIYKKLRVKKKNELE